MEPSRLSVCGTVVRCVAPILFGAMLAACSTVARDPAQVHDAGRQASTLELRQQQTGTAYRQLEQVRFDLKLAEQDWLNANAAYQRAQKSADELKQQANAAHQALLAAQAREAQARAAYEQAMKAVDEAYQSGTASEKR